jgi:hypothetical protein
LNNGTVTLVLVGVGAALMFSHFGPMGLVMMGVIAFFLIK